MKNKKMSVIGEKILIPLMIRMGQGIMLTTIILMIKYGLNINQEALVMKGKPYLIVGHTMIIKQL